MKDYADHRIIQYNLIRWGENLGNGHEIILYPEQYVKGSMRRVDLMGKYYFNDEVIEEEIHIEVKSSYMDLNSGSGLNLDGKFNYIACPPHLVDNVYRKLKRMKRPDVGIIVGDGEEYYIEKKCDFPYDNTSNLVEQKFIDEIRII